MAILNIKNFPDDLYDRLKEKAAEERRSVSQEVIHIVERAVQEPAAPASAAESPPERAVR